MNPWFAKAVILIAIISMMLIRAPHGRRSRTVKVARSRKGALDVALLGVAWVALLMPVLWVATAPMQILSPRACWGWLRG